MTSRSGTSDGIPRPVDGEETGRTRDGDIGSMRREVAELRDDIRRLTSALQSQIDELAARDREQREMVLDLATRRAGDVEVSRAVVGAGDVRIEIAVRASKG